VAVAPVRIRYGLFSRYALPQMLADATSWLIALGFFGLARFDFVVGAFPRRGFVLLAPLAVACQIATGQGLRLYRGRYRVGSFDEVTGVVIAAAVTAIVVLGVDVVSFRTHPLPASVPLGAGAAAVVAMLGVRYGWRTVIDRRRRPRPEGCQRMLVFGAGDGGEQVIRAMLREPLSPYFPVGLLDDDPAKRHLQICGVAVIGTRQAMAEAAAATNATAVLIAVPSADAAVLRELSTQAEHAGLAVKVLPAVSELFGDAVGLRDIRDINLEDLLGRRPVETDLDSIAGYLTGKRVLVTGAGGSIGSELSRQIERYAPAELMMLDRDESALHAVQLSITGRALLDSTDVILADIRDIGHLNTVFDHRRPQVVFHAAALKHLPMLEQYPGEAVKTNVWGTLSVLQAAAAAGVERFVNISTDKAADPISVLGYSKRIAERLTAHVAAEATGTYLSVRFGNVLGSRGSVLTTFAAQVAAGGPVTVTDPLVTRYFMTVQEAVQLVIQAGAIGHDGEALVLDMGKPVSIDEVARLLAGKSPRPVEIVYTGLRSGEKLHEDLLAAGEPDVRPVHPLISHVPVRPLDPVTALEIDPWGSRRAVVESVQDLLSDPEVPVRARCRATDHGATMWISAASSRFAPSLSGAKLRENRD
jgi:FlaA1/EpsC-like NDP-sugar epimerase